MTPPRERQPSSPLLESHDEPRAISPAQFDAHLQAHALLEQRLEAAARRSDPVQLSGHGWTFQGRGGYLLAIGALAVLAFWLWLRK